MVWLHNRCNCGGIKVFIKLFFFFFNVYYIKSIGRVFALPHLFFNIYYSRLVWKVLPSTLRRVFNDLVTSPLFVIGYVYARALACVCVCVWACVLHSSEVKSFLVICKEKLDKTIDCSPPSVRPYCWVIYGF